MNDTNFDDRATKFANNIYGTTKGKVREAVLWHLLQQQFLPSLCCGGRVLDAGGGQGQMTLRLAQQGYEVVLTDLSSEMLQFAQQQAQQLAVAAQLQLIEGPIQQLQQHQLGQFDGVICHAVLEWVKQPEQVIVQLFDHLKPGGLLSLAFFNLRGAELHNLVSGNFDNVGAALTAKKTKRVRLVPHSPLQNEQVLAMTQALGFELVSQAGVRVIHDYLRDKSHQQTKLERLIELEIEYCQQPLYRDLGRYTHLLLRKPYLTD
ncbi:methyltransferase domain-containing protein [Ferrimonas lipolytica]|uniref:tRNA 5-carboxymethoxyuridine methyltransferase n=1 Tax=Ferrimonas lipolytica TaxID=2724191 RepID=A0A6H1UBE5_9GAMM|nr:methyltransferase domain-containing protein [Ferrimonas lipolytica]QIZ76381.1 methyltransferase domain-containing protein [Ferrimonas lipolytica]